MTKDYYTIEPDPRFPDEVVVWEHGVYPKSSVLAGEDRRSWRDTFKTIEEAKKAYPTAEVMEWSTGDSFKGILPEPANDMSQVAPDWFDPANAGEVWHEDDY